MQYTHKNPFSLPAMASALALLLLVEEEKMEVCSPQRPDVMPHAKELFGSKFSPNTHLEWRQVVAIVSFNALLNQRLRHLKNVPFIHYK